MVGVWLFYGGSRDLITGVSPKVEEREISGIGISVSEEANVSSVFFNLGSIITGHSWRVVVVDGSKEGYGFMDLDEGWMIRDDILWIFVSLHRVVLICLGEESSIGLSGRLITPSKERVFFATFFLLQEDPFNTNWTEEYGVFRCQTPLSQST